MQMRPAAITGLAILLLSAGASARGKTVAAKQKPPAVVRATTVPNTLAIPKLVAPQKRAKQAGAYADLVDHVSGSLDQFTEDNVAGGDARDRIGDDDTNESADESESTTQEPHR